MKCSNCEYLYYSEYERFTSCRIFGCGILDKYKRKDGNGCICNGKQLAKMFHKNEEVWMKEAKIFVDWI